MMREGKGHTLFTTQFNVLLLLVAVSDRQESINTTTRANVRSELEVTVMTTGA